MIIRQTYRLTVFCLSVLLLSCQRSPEEAPVMFTLLSPERTGVDFMNRLTEGEQFNIIEYLYFNNGGGVAAGDINNDGLTDLYFTANQEKNRLYLNRGGFRFKEITGRSGTGGAGDWSTGVSMADVNGDGWLDIYVCQVGNYKGLQGRNQLFINQKDLTFKEEASPYGVDFQGYSTQAAFFDYDLDGDLDLYLLNHSVHTSRSYGMANLRTETDERAGDRLYRNEHAQGNARFTDVTGPSGIYSSPIGYGLGVSISDINGDGYPDIYISNDFHENDYLYINNGDGTFSDHLSRMVAHTSRSSMGNDVADMNNDGMPDVVVLDMLPDEEQILKQSGGEDDYELFQLKLRYGYSQQFVRNTLQLNLGGDIFSEIGRYAGIHATDWSWAPLFCDLDNDGWKDLFITNGIYRRANDLDYVDFLTGGNRDFPTRDNSALTDRDLYERMPLYPNVNYMYRNNGNLTFTNMAGEWGIEDRTFSNGAAYADLDNDGDLDLVTNNINATASILENHAGELTGNHFLTVELKEDGFNPYAVGAKVTLYCGEQQMMAEQFTTRGFMSASSSLLHFGLGSISFIDSVVVRWTDRTGTVYRTIAADQQLTLVRGEGGQPGKKAHDPENTPGLFGPVEVQGLDYQHREDGFTDMLRERLIPHDLSAEGPAMAAGDINGDGREDLFIGASSGFPASLYLQTGTGRFRKLSVPLLNHDRLTEDVGAAFFDADGDGWLDLYIVRGGNEFPAGDPMLADRLLMNDGQGNLTRGGGGRIPYMAANGSCVRPCDFDGDGDTDLFVGTRSIPGAYGLPADQFLLVNNGEGYFTQVSRERAPVLKGLGMVTDACWVDDDGDGDPDLVLVGEWMPVTILRNREGRFSDEKEKAGLGETSGWWNCIEAADADGDGDMDLICGNLGLNTVLKASRDEPLDLYVLDFDNNGTPEPLICAYREGTSYPIATLDELNRQMPGIRDQFESYAAFGGKTAAEIFGPEKMDQAYHKQALLLTTTLYLNNGTGRYKAKELPGEAQFSPVRDVVTADVDLDGHTDLILAGNDFTAMPSVGRYDASYGWCLQGDGTGAFHSLMPRESGLMIKGDARILLWLEGQPSQLLLAAVNNGRLQCFRTLQR